MRELRRQILFVSVAVVSLLTTSGCASNENAHTTATTIVPPPPRQVLAIAPITSESKVPSSPCETESKTKPIECVGVDPTKPLLVFDLPKDTFRMSEVVPINFSVRNAKLRSEGGEFRLRHIIDDDDAQWVDSPQPFGLAGWVAGKHTIRLELIGPDGWPYKNGNHNIITREITVTEQ